MLLRRALPSDASARWRRCGPLPSAPLPRPRPVVNADAASADAARAPDEAGPGRSLPAAATAATTTTPLADDEEDFSRNGWARDPRFVRVDFSQELAQGFRRQFAALLSPAADGEARARLAWLALLVSAEDDAVAAPTTVPFPVASWLARVRRLADGAEAAAIAARKAWREGWRRQQQLEQQQEPQQGNANAKSEEEEEELAVFAAVEQYLYDHQGFEPHFQGRNTTPISSSPWWPRSALSPRRRYDHPGTAEQPRRAYLHEALTRKRGTHPSVLAILLADVHARLLLRGATRRAAVVDNSGGGRWTGAPTARPSRALTLRAALSGGGGGGGEARGRAEEEKEDEDEGTAWPLAAFASFDPLLESLRHLKRAYWPFLWDTNADGDDGDQKSGDNQAGGGKGGAPSPSSSPPRKISHGGFGGAAKAALGVDEDAALRVVSAAAKHRLERGIFTSPGAGDLRRCLAACERIVLVLDARTRTASDARRHAADLALERRDLGALLLHAGRFDEAAAELGAYAEARRRGGVGGGGGGGGGSAVLMGGGGVGVGGGASSSSRLAGVPRPWEGGGASGAAAAAAGGDDDDGAVRWDTAFEAALAERLLEMARGSSSSGGGDGGGAALGASARCPPLTVERELREDGGGARASSGPPQRHTW
jgi:hypothetical protein